MTTYRHPYNRSLQTGRTERPPLMQWLVDKKKDMDALTRSQKHTVYYWEKMYWATPPWLTDEQVAAMKVLWQSANPAFQHVDHIVPLTHDLVCGLNVPWNVRVTTIKDNLTKSNHHWPDCPDHLCPLKNLPEDMFGGFLDLTLCNVNKQLELGV